MLGKIDGRRRRETAEDKIFGWQHRLNGHESEKALGVGDGQGSLAYCKEFMGLQRVRHNLEIEQQT